MRIRRDRQREGAGLGGGDNGLGNGMTEARLGRGGIGQQFIFTQLGKAMNGVDLRLFLGQGAGFVKDNGVNRLEQFQRTPIFNQDALLCRRSQIVQHPNRASEA